MKHLIVVLSLLFLSLTADASYLRMLDMNGNGGKTMSITSDTSFSLWDADGRVLGLQEGVTTIEIVDGSATVNNTTSPFNANEFWLMLDAEKMLDYVYIAGSGAHEIWGVEGKRVVWSIDGAKAVSLASPRAVPLPGAVWLFGSALFGLVVRFKIIPHLWNQSRGQVLQSRISSKRLAARLAVV